MDYLYLSQEEVIACGGLDMQAVVENLERVFAGYGRKEHIQPTKTSIRWSDEPDTEEKLGRIMCMPAYLGGEFQVSGLKWVHSVPHNPQLRNLPRGIALIVLTDPASGLPLAVMDGTLISAMRTGGVTGLGAKYLADPTSEIVAVVGAGVQARTQLMALMAVLPSLNRIKLYDPQAGRMEGLAREMAESFPALKFILCGSARECIEDAHVVTTPTMAARPYLEADWLSQGAFYADVSSHDPEVAVYLRADKLVVDDLEEVKRYEKIALAKALSEGRLKDADIYANLGEIVAGLKPGRESSEELIIFRPIGLAVADVGEAYRIYREAKERGIGAVLKLWDKPVWI